MIETRFEIPQGHYTKEELNYNIKYSIFKMVNTPIKAYSRQFLVSKEILPFHYIILLEVYLLK